MAIALKMVSHKLCPYVQRAVIALSEKGVAVERIDIDLANKPDWFLKISPLGKVPVLLVETADGEAGVFESNVICDYIEDTQGRRKAASAWTRLRRAQHRAVDGVRLHHSRRTIGASRRPAILQSSRASGRRFAAKVCTRREALGAGPILQERTSAWWSSVRADLPLFRCVRSADPISRYLPIRRRSAHGERRWRSGQACARRSDPTIRNCCTRSWCAMTRIC
jgi:glutathione S-transferase